MRRTPPKSRGPERRKPSKPTKAQQREPEQDQPSYVPPHLGGSFDDAGYRAGAGTFGFTQHVTP